MTGETIDESLDENDDLKESLKKRLELELGLPLTPKLIKKIERDFYDDLIFVENFPIVKVKSLRIGDVVLSEDDYFMNESEGIIYLKSPFEGLLCLEYCYGLSESEYEPLLDLMVEYERDTSWNKNAASISEKNVSVSYDTSLGTGARIQSMIQDLRNKYSCYVEMI